MSSTATLQPRVGRRPAEGGTVVPFRPRPTRRANGALNDAPPFTSLPGVPTPDLTPADVYDAIRAVFRVHKQYRLRRIGMRMTIACALLLAFAGGVWLPESVMPAAAPQGTVPPTAEPDNPIVVDGLGNGVAGAAAMPLTTTGGPAPDIADPTSLATAVPARAPAGPTLAVEPTAPNSPPPAPPTAAKADAGEEPALPARSGPTSAASSDPVPSSSTAATAVGGSVGSGSVHASGGVTRSELSTHQAAVVQVRNHQAADVNVRPRPLAEGEPLRSLASNEAVEVLCVSPGERIGDPNGPWYRLVSGGWVSSTAVSPEGGTPPPCAGG